MQIDSPIKIIRSSTIPESLNIFCRGFLRQLAEHNYEVIAISAPGEALQTIEQRENVRTISINMERRISPLKDLISLVKLIICIHKEKPTIVHSITPKAGLLCMIASRICKVPIRIHTFTGLVFPTAKGIKQKILILTDRITCACASHIIPEGYGVKSDLEKFKITSKPLTVLGYGNLRGIDLKYYSRTIDVIESANKIRKNDCFTFIFIGRIVRDKGINELIEAFCRLNKEFSKTRLILVGHFESEIDPISKTSNNAIKANNSIEFVGYQSDIRPWLAASDVFVFPSYREGFPNVVIEAGAMGVPSIVTDINGSREIIINNENGCIIPPQDSNALYEMMKKFLLNNDQTLRMASNARSLIENRFEQSFVRNCQLNYYKSLLKNL